MYAVGFFCLIITASHTMERVPDIRVLMVTSDVLEHKWRASLKLHYYYD